LSLLGISIIGLILGLVGRFQARNKAFRQHPAGTAGWIIGLIGLIFWTIYAWRCPTLCTAAPTTTPAIGTASPATSTQAPMEAGTASTPSSPQGCPRWVAETWIRRATSRPLGTRQGRACRIHTRSTTKRPSSS
jgi:hypothetical protein